MIKFVNKELQQIDKIEKDTDMTIEEAIIRHHIVPIWSHKVDTHILSVGIHIGLGFMISIDGDNHSKTNIAYVVTFLDFRMLEEMKQAMDEHKHLIDEELYK